MHRRWAVVKRLSAWFALLLTLQCLACGSTSVTQMTAPDPARCQTTLGTVPTLPAAGGRTSVDLVAARECGWTASSNSSWIQVSPTSGQGEASITLTTTANPQGTTRSGNIAVNGTQFAVTQVASPCTFSVSPSSVAVPPAGGPVSVRVVTLTGCSWTAASVPSWLTVDPSKGDGPSDVTIDADNNGGGARTATLTLGGRSVTVTQAAVPPSPAPGPSPSPAPAPSPGPPPPAPAPPPGCTYAIDPLVRNIKDKGGDGTVKVITDAGCSWTAVSNVPWVLVKGDASGTGTHDVKYEVDRNRDAERTGTITIAGLTHIIVQDSGD